MDLKDYTWRTLNVSTAHIPKHTADDLESCVIKKDGALWVGVSYVPYHEYGWIFYAGGSQAEMARECGHPELAALLEFAAKHRFDYLQLDCDGGELPEEAGLPTFEW